MEIIIGILLFIFVVIPLLIIAHFSQVMAKEIRDLNLKLDAFLRKK
jgi:hypothetical protein